MDSASATHAAEQWSTLFRTCFVHRIPASQLNKPFSELWSTQPIPGSQLASIIFTSGASGIDPLITEYLEQILRATTIDTCDILVALLAHTRYALKKNASTRTSLSNAFFEHILALLVRLVAAGERPKTAREARNVVRALGECLTACRAHEMVLLMQNVDVMQSPDPQVVTCFETLATLAIAVLNHPMVKADISDGWPQTMKDKIASACSDFAELISPWSHSQTGAGLQMLAKTPPLGKPDFSTAEIASTVNDLPVTNSRVGLYIYLNAALCARPLTDDMSLFNYLHAKYQNDTQSLVSDLIVASFDVLANALQQLQPPNQLLCYRSFIANKLPLLITTLSASFPPMTSQVHIQMALRRVDVHPFPPLSSDNDTANNEILKKSRLEFVQACILFQLGNEQAFHSVIGESPAPIAPRVVRYNRQSLAQQCSANIHRVEELARELEGMNGNAGAISGALVDTIQHLYTAKETMALRTVCNIFSRRLPLMDIILQYAQPSDVLSPLCNLLNEWTHDEDQSEYQPAYEEFAAVLLLVLAVIHRYQLTEAEIGAFSTDSFIIRLLKNMSTSIDIRALDDDQQKQLTKWVQGLYATDEHGETNGISDETMSHCPPQSFYLLVPTLFEQSVQACKLMTLAVNTLKGGLEFLLEPFLLPSLIGGLSWVTKHSWEDHGDTDILMQMLRKLIQPDSISGDAQAMHKTILAMIARPLARSLQELQRRQPKRKDVTPVIELLQPHLDSQRSGKCNSAELTEWSVTADGGLRAVVKNLVGGLVQWSNQGSISSIPYQYTHRAITTALDMLGADEVLAIILDEVRSQTRSGCGSAALEVATAIVCTPSPLPALSQANTLMQFDQSAPVSVSQRRTLRQALRARLDEPKELLAMETERVETIVRLGRRVEAQLSVPAQLNMPMTNLDLGDMNLTGADMQITGAEMQMTADTTTDTTGAAAAVTDQDFTAAMDQSLQMDTTNMNDTNSMPLDMPNNLFAGQDMDFDLTGTSQQHGTGQMNNEDDIFAGLEMDLGGDDFDFS
ncbi:mediator complex, subunit Med5, partial [Aureobasidium melanogenum]